MSYQVSPAVQYSQFGGCHELPHIASIGVEHVEKQVLAVSVKLDRRQLAGSAKHAARVKQNNAKCYACRPGGIH